MQLQFPLDIYAENASFRSLSLQTASITDAMIKAGANLATGKLIHRYSYSHRQANGSAIVAVTEMVRMIRAQASLLAVQAAIETVASGADRTVSVDLQKSTGGGAFATMLSAPISFTNLSAVRTAVAATMVSTTFVAGDIVRFVIAVAGAAGAQAQGLIVNADIDEYPS